MMARNYSKQSDEGQESVTERNGREKRIPEKYDDDDYEKPRSEVVALAK